MRTLSATLLGALLLSAATAAAPLQITGRVLHAPKDVQVELRPWTVEHAEALRQLKGEPVPPLATARPRLDGSFAVEVPDTGFYSVVVRAPGHLAMERFVQFVVEDTETPPVELPPASPLEVKAVGADGQPLAGVTIQAIPLEKERGDWRAAGRSAVTDAEGRAVFPRAEDEALRLTVTTAGRYATAATGSKGASETVRFPARRFRIVEFRGAGGKPAAGALVRLAFRGWPYGLTGEDGRIPLPVPEENEIGLFAEDAKGLRVEVVMTVEAGEGTDVPVVALRSPALAAGRVLEASSREPIAGALVWNGGTSWTRTGSGGAFEIRAPSAPSTPSENRGRIEAAAAGHTQARHPWRSSESPPVTLTLEPAAAIAGQVVDPAGRPVEGAEVTTLTNPADFGTGGLERKRSWSGPDGRFALRQVPAGRLHSVTALKEGFAPARQLADSTAPVRLVLRQGTVAVGRVVDEQGLAVAGAELTLTATDRDPAPGSALDFRTASDAEGRFRLANVSAGRFELRAVKPGFAAATVPGILIPEGEPLADLGDLTLPPGAAIEGIVVDERDRPVQGAEVVLTPYGSDGSPAAERLVMGRAPVETGADGRFRIADLPRGTRFGLRAAHPELVAAEMDGLETPTAEPVRLRLALPRSLEGRVKDWQGEPVSQARLFVSDSAGESRIVWGRGPMDATTDAEGRFVLSGLRPGTAYVTATAHGYRTRASQPVEIPAQGQAPLLEIVLEPGTFLEGFVWDGRNHLVPGAHVHVQLGDPVTAAMSFQADGNGRYKVDDLEPGPVEVQATFQGSGSARVKGQIRPGRNRLDVKISGGTEVSGRIVDSQGSPVPGATLTLDFVPGEGESPPFLPGSQAVSSADGSFVFQAVADGEYRLTGIRQGFAPATLPGIQVAGAPVSGLELRLGPGAVIRGRLLGLEPSAWSRVQVGAHSPDARTVLDGVVAPSGSYRIQEASPGSWILMARLGSSEMVTAQVEVGPGDKEVVQDLEIPSGFTLTGRVLLDRGPLSRADVTAHATDTDRRAGGRSETAHDGTFRLERLPAGSYLLQVMTSLGPVHVRTLDIGGNRDLTIEIATGAVEGRLLSPQGLPVAGAVVSLRAEHPNMIVAVGPTSSSDDQGAFEVLRVPEGTYRMTVRAAGFAPAESRIVVTPGGTAHVDLVLAPIIIEPSRKR